MPLVIVSYQQSFLSREGERGLGAFTRVSLPRIIAEALTVPGTEAELAPGEVEIQVHQVGPLDFIPFDITVTVLANSYPERDPIRHRAAEYIRAQTLAFFTIPTKANAYVHLGLGGYSEGTSR